MGKLRLDLEKNLASPKYAGTHDTFDCKLDLKSPQVNAMSPISSTKTIMSGDAYAPFCDVVHASFQLVFFFPTLQEEYKNLSKNLNTKASTDNFKILVEVLTN